MRAPRLLGLVAASITLAAVLFLFVLPSRTYLAQRHSLSAAQTRLKVFSDQNAKLAAAAERLQSDTEIERLARERYGLVKPGEKAYLFTPSPVAGRATPAPPNKKSAQPGTFSRVWHDLQFWN
ncbi:MAG: septum formation initiator family protein [Actinomycetota bacterium]|nr:septum formation initiator family protein [Actinomycetota bacterium]